MGRQPRKRAKNPSVVARSLPKRTGKAISTWTAVRCSPSNPRVSTKVRGFPKPRSATRMRASTARARCSMNLRGSRGSEPSPEVPRTPAPSRSLRPRGRPMKTLKGAPSRSSSSSSRSTAASSRSTSASSRSVSASPTKRPVGRPKNTPSSPAIVLQRCIVRVSPLRSPRKVCIQKSPRPGLAAPLRNPLRAIGFHENTRAIDDACASDGENIAGMTAEEFVEIQLELEDILKRLSRRKALLVEQVKAVSNARSMTRYMEKTNVQEKFNEPMGQPREPKPTLEEHAFGIPLHQILAQKTWRSDRSSRGNRQTSSAPNSDGEMSGDKTKKAAKPRKSKKTHQNIVHKFDVPEKFWKFVEPYCGPITPDNLEYLDQVVKGNAYTEQLLKFSAMLEKHRAAKRSGDTTTEEESDDEALPALNDAEKELIRRMGITTEVYNGLRKSSKRAANRHLSQHSPNRLSSGSSPNVARANGNATDNPVVMSTRGQDLGGPGPSRAAGSDRRPKNPLTGEAVSENHDPDEAQEDWRPVAEKLELLQKMNRKIIEHVTKQAAVQLEKQEIFRRLDEIDTARAKALGKVPGTPGKEVTMDPSKWNKEIEQRLCRERSELVKRLRKAYAVSRRMVAEPFPGIPPELRAMLNVRSGPSTSRTAMAGPSTSAGASRHGRASAKEPAKPKRNSQGLKKPKSTAGPSSASSGLSAISANACQSRKRKASHQSPSSSK